MNENSVNTVDESKMSRHDLCVVITIFVISAVFTEDYLEPDCTPPCRCYWGRNRLTLTASCRYTNSLHRIPNDIPRKATDIIVEGDFSKIEKFDWSNWTSLRSLYLPGIGLNQIGSHFLHGLLELEELTLGSNNISFISNDAFLNVPKIRYLDLSSNALTSWQSYRGLENLQKIHLRNNRIQYLPAGSFQRSKHLNYIGLSINSLKELHGDTFKGLTKLKTLTLAMNKISRLSKDVFRSLKNLQSLDLRKNSIQSIDVGCFNEVKKLEKLVLTENKLTGLPPGLFSNLNQLLRLNMDHNLLQINQDEHIFIGLSKLVSLDMRYNRLQHLYSDIFSPLKRVEILNLEHNNITRIHPNSFRGLKSLRSLDLSFNNIKEIEPNTFQHLTSLKELHLHTNKLTRLESHTFRGLEILSDLFLSKNRISWIHEDAFVPLRSSLTVLQFAYNSLTNIDEKTLASLSHLNALFLIGNRLKCSCKLTTLLRSMNIDWVMGDCFIVHNKIQNQTKGMNQNSSLLRNSILRDSIVVTETEYETFNNLTIHDYHLLDICGRGCENTAHFQLLECRDCSANPGTTCSNFDPFRDHDFACWKFNVRKSNGIKGTADECKTSSCVTSKMCSNPLADGIVRVERNKIPSGNEKMYWIFLVIVSPGAIILLVILVVFIRTRLGTQSPPRSNNIEGLPAHEDSANIPLPQSNNSEGSPAYEDSANIPPPQSNDNEGLPA